MYYAAYNINVKKYKEAIKEVALIKNNMKQELKTVIKSAKKELK